jgi:hypothetical protein
MGPDTKLANSGITSSHKLVGHRVENPQGENLGKVEDVMIDTEEGRVAYAVISFGGFMGVGNKLFAFPWSALHLRGKEPKVILDITKEALETAPGFPKDKWPDMNDRVWGASVHSYYKTEPYWH